MSIRTRSMIAAHLLTRNRGLTIPLQGKNSSEFNLQGTKAAWIHKWSPPGNKAKDQATELGTNCPTAICARFKKSARGAKTWLHGGANRPRHSGTLVAVEGSGDVRRRDAAPEMKLAINFDPERTGIDPQSRGLSVDGRGRGRWQPRGQSQLQNHQ